MKALVPIGDQRIATRDQLLWADTMAYFMCHIWTFCPGCGHAENLHAGGVCYGSMTYPFYCAANCHWSIIGDGAFVKRGWHNFRLGLFVETPRP